MKVLKAWLVCIALAFAGAPAQAERIYNQPELDALLAPIALYPDSLLSHILMAATYPEDVAAAAAWSRANSYLRGEDAVRAVQGEPWDPSVKSLVAFPEVLARMDESPQWTRDLGEAFLRQEPHVMDTIQALRRRAQASGGLRSDERYSVADDGGAIVVAPRTEVIYVPYYDPYVVYGPWWWVHYRPVYWRPWPVRQVVVSHTFFFGGFDWHRHHVRVIHRPVYQDRRIRHVEVLPGKWQHRPPEHRPPQQRFFGHAAPRTTVREFQRVPESRRQPIIQSAPRVPLEHRRPDPHRIREVHTPFQTRMPAASGFSQNFHRADSQRGGPQRVAPKPVERQRGGGRGNDGHRGKSWRN